MSDGLVVREENRGLMQGVDNPAIYAAAVSVLNLGGKYRWK